MKIDHLSRWSRHQSPVLYDPETHEVVMLDQRLLPNTERWLRYEDASEVASAIREMVVRGAPAIGCSAAFGLAAAAQRYPTGTDAFRSAFRRDHALLAAARPTAVNLFWALDQCQAVFEDSLAAGGQAAVQAALCAKAQQIWQQDRSACEAMGRFGAALIGDGARVLTHCNAGALATAGYGTALGVVRALAARDPGLKVFADETRPFLQGARLTAWELAASGIDVTVICDNMSGSLMRAGAISHAVVGADRIAANGDTANKIGTYMVAVLAARHRIPFYVAAPRSTIDLNTPHGDQIAIEERPAREVTHCGEQQLVPEGVPVRNIAFDVTPAELIAGIITEAGVVTAPYGENLAMLFS